MHTNFTQGYKNTLPQCSHTHYIHKYPHAYRTHTKTHTDTRITNTHISYEFAQPLHNQRCLPHTEDTMIIVYLIYLFLGALTAPGIVLSALHILLLNCHSHRTDEETGTARVQTSAPRHTAGKWHSGDCLVLRDTDKTDKDAHITCQAAAVSGSTLPPAPAQHPELQTHRKHGRPPARGLLCGP